MCVRLCVCAQHNTYFRYELCKFELITNFTDTIIYAAMEKKITNKQSKINSYVTPYHKIYTRHIFVLSRINNLYVMPRCVWDCRYSTKTLSVIQKKKKTRWYMFMWLSKFLYRLKWKGNMQIGPPYYLSAINIWILQMRPLRLRLSNVH